MTISINGMAHVLGLVSHLVRNILPLRGGKEFCQASRDIVRHGLPLLHEIAAIDRDRAPGHPAGLVGGEKEDRADNVFGLAHAAERDLRNRGAALFGIGVARAGQSGQGRAGGDRIDADAVRRQFERHRMGPNPH